MVATRAIVRAPGRTYPEALTRQEPRPAVDLELTQRQHKGYVATLRHVGLKVTELPADDEYADAVFVQDRVCVLDGRAIVGPRSRLATERPLRWSKCSDARSRSSSCRLLPASTGGTC